MCVYVYRVNPTCAVRGTAGPLQRPQRFSHGADDRPSPPPLPLRNPPD